MSFQLARLLLEAPRVEEWVVRDHRDVAARQLLQGHTTLEEELRRLFRRTLTRNDPRFLPLTLQQVKGLRRTAIQKWLSNMVRNCPMEVSIVGDEARSVMLELAQRHLGPLRERPRQDHSMAGKRTLKPLVGPEAHSLEVREKKKNARLFLGVALCSLAPGPPASNHAHVCSPAEPEPEAGPSSGRRPCLRCGLFSPCKQGLSPAVLDRDFLFHIA